MTLKPETRDELLLTTTAAAALTLEVVASGRVLPNVGPLLASLNRLVPRAVKEFAEGGPAMPARRTSKYVQDVAFPRIVCVCGDDLDEPDAVFAYVNEAKEGKITLAQDLRDEGDLFLRKIDLADEILVVVHADQSRDTLRHVAYARAKGKRVRFTDEAAGLAWLEGKKSELDAMAGRFG